MMIITHRHVVDHGITPATEYPKTKHEVPSRRIDGIGIPPPLSRTLVLLSSPRKMNESHDQSVLFVYPRPLPEREKMTIIFILPECERAGTTE